MKLRVLVTTAALVLTLTACGASGSKSDLPKLSSTPSAAKKTTGTPLDRVPEAPPKAPKGVQSKAGALNFGSYVFDVLFYTLATNDVDELFSIADAKLCWTCNDLRDTIEKRTTSVQVGSEPHQVSQGKVIANSGDFYTVRQLVKFPDGAEVDKKTGKVSEKLTAKLIRMNVNMRWHKGAWVLLNYKSVNQKDQ